MKGIFSIISVDDYHVRVEYIVRKSVIWNKTNTWIKYKKIKIIWWDSNMGTVYWRLTTCHLNQFTSNNFISSVQLPKWISGLSCGTYAQFGQQCYFYNISCAWWLLVVFLCEQPPNVGLYIVLSMIRVGIYCFVKGKQLQ